MVDIRRSIYIIDDDDELFEMWIMSEVDRMARYAVHRRNIVDSRLPRASFEMSASATVAIKAISGDDYVDPLLLILKTILTVVSIEFECDTRRNKWHNPTGKPVLRKVHHSQTPGQTSSICFLRRYPHQLKRKRLSQRIQLNGQHQFRIFSHWLPVPLHAHIHWSPPPSNSIVDLQKTTHKPPTSGNPYPTPTSPRSISSYSSTKSSSSLAARSTKKRPRPKRKATHRPLSKVYSYPPFQIHLLELTVVVSVTFVEITGLRRLDLSFPNGLGNKNCSLMTYVSCLVTLVTAGAQPLTRPRVLIIVTPNITRRGIR